MGKAKTGHGDTLQSMKWKRLTIIYTLFLVVLVFLADRRESQFLFRFVRMTPNADKLGHLLLMGLFAFLLNLALSCKKIRLWRFNLLAGSLLVALVVTIEEFSQIFVRYRSFDPIDLLFDFAGILLFGWLANVMMKTRQTRPDEPS